jgi:4'-phosphopantetheinyl transferase EntD
VSVTSPAAAESPHIQLAGLFPEKVATHLLDLRRESGAVHADEEQYVRNAGSRRRVEFAGGRFCSRQAFVRLGVKPCAVGRREDGAPVWPDGLVGSISHTDVYCGAVVARRADYRYLGLDIEKVGSLERECWPIVLTGVEREQCATLPARAVNRYAALVFSAKECVFKSLYPVSGVFLEFHNLSIAPEPSTGTFRISPRLDLRLKPGTVDNLRGRFLFFDGHVFTALAFSDE